MVKLNSNATCREVRFLADGFQLKGYLHLPEEKHPPVIIGSHGLLSNSQSPKQLELARLCNTNNIAYFRFDHRGCGESQGRLEDGMSLKARKIDLLNAIETIESNNEIGNQIGVFGSSMGGSACIAAAAHKNIDAMVIFAAPFRINKTVELSNLPTEYENQFHGKIHLEFDLSNTMPGIHNILIFHGDMDEVIPYSDAMEIYNRSNTPKKIITLQNGDHRMSQLDHQKLFVAKTVQWFKHAFFQ